MPKKHLTTKLINHPSTQRPTTQVSNQKLKKQPFNHPQSQPNSHKNKKINQSAENIHPSNHQIKNQPLNHPTN